MFRMSFAEQLGLTCQALVLIHRRSPDVEEILRSGERQDLNSLKTVRLASWSQTEFDILLKKTLAE